MGDEAFLLRGLGSRAADAARRLNGANLDGLVEATACFGTVALYVSPERFSTEAALGLIEQASDKPLSAKEHRIPFCAAMGEDLEECAERLSLSASQLVERLAETELECLAIGFSPGFPYLGPLPDELRGLPRREKPRARVPQGSVAIAEAQACIYPQERPGGWNLIGRTPLTLVDVEEDWFPIEAGDRVRLEPISEERFAELEGRRL